MPKLYALLVGINEYAPGSGVSSLDGCLNDVKAVKTFLKKEYADLEPAIKTLTNKNATRKKLITTFQTHFKQAKAGDTILFYYSGHGSTSPTATEFEAFDAQQQDETLVCYDSRLKGHYDLADKEIAVLLSRIASKVHISLWIDSCYSGSISRSVADNMNLGRKRFASSVNKKRDIKDYLLAGDDYYTNMLTSQNSINIPQTPHIVLSACTRNQEAWETSDARGLFTSSLLEVLEKNARVSYSDVFTRVRRTIKKNAKNQDPTIDPQGKFNHNKMFLLNQIVENPNRHQVYYEDGYWRMEYGAIHSLPTDKIGISEIKIALFPDLTAANTQELIAQVGVKSVGLKECILDFDEAKTDQFFQAEIISLASKLQIFLDGVGKAEFLKIYAKKPSAFLHFVEDATLADYRLEVGKEQLTIYKKENNQLIQGVKHLNVNTVLYIKGVLESLEEWERIANLNNEQSKFAENAINITFEHIDDNYMLLESYEDVKIIDLAYPKRGEDKKNNGEDVVNWYTLKAKNNTQRPLFISLLQLSPNFSINNYHKCALIRPNETLILDDQHGLLLNEADNKQTDLFKILVSTAEFDDYQFHSDGFELGKVLEKVAIGINTKKVVSRRKPEDDWLVKSIQVNTIRQVGAVRETDVNYNNEIIIKGHAKFKANVSFTPIKSGTRSLDLHPSANLAAIFNAEDTEILNLSSTRSTSDKSVIELSNISEENSLAEAPLALVINKKLKKNEQIIPVTYDGTFVVPIGTSEAIGKQTKINIERLPDQNDTNKKKSIGKAFWFCLLKVAGFRDHAFRLRYIRYNKKGKIVKTIRAINSKVDKAQKILLLVHGIVGDTKMIAKNLKPLLDNKYYDLILCYDYENLNEPIESISKALNKLLEEVGLKTGHTKNLDIIAHSMGGLVSRHLLETVKGGEAFANRLIMFGTPNGGSVFGSLPQYRDMLTKLMGVALNFGKIWLGPISIYLESLNKILVASEQITVTLDQMNEKSNFIKTLFKNTKANTKYILIAGDITDYTATTDGRFSRFKEQVLLKIGNLAHMDIPNDIAVSVDQIKAIPVAFSVEEYDLVCHHLNYFDADSVGLKLLMQLVASNEKGENAKNEA